MHKFCISWINLHIFLILSGPPTLFYYYYFFGCRLLLSSWSNWKYVSQNFSVANLFRTANFWCFMLNCLNRNNIWLLWPCFCLTLVSFPIIYFEVICMKENLTGEASFTLEVINCLIVVSKSTVFAVLADGIVLQ